MTDKYKGILYKTLLLSALFTLLLSYSVSAQVDTVNGTVMDAQSDETLPGVNISIKGTTSGTSTDLDGTYSLNIQSLSDTLVFSYIGYQTLEIPVDGRTYIDATLTQQAFLGEEMVVVGYGTQRRSDITSAVSVIDITDVGERPITTASSLLQGQAAGVVVRQTTGTPGQEMEINIRGIGSLGAGSEPLYVIDGFPVGTSMGQNINPTDIESITVLKDAASTAIYGARGSNGVIQITTKLADMDEVSISFNATSGVQNIPNSRRTPMMNGVEFSQFKKESFMDKIRNFEGREPDIDEVPMSFRYPEETQYSTDWMNEILNQNASFQNYNMTVGAGSGSIRSLVSVGYTNQQGAVIETGFERFNARANLNGDINDNISVGWNLAGSFSREEYAPTSGRDAIIGSAMWADPREPVFNDDGSYNAYVGGNDGIFGTPNLVMELTEMDRNRNTADLTSNGYLQISFLNNFQFKSSVNASIVNGRQKEFRPSYLAGRGFDSPPPREAYQNESHNETVKTSTDQLLTYTKSIGSHDITTLAGFSAQEETWKRLSASGNEYPDDIVRFLNVAETVDAGSSEESWSLLAYFGRFNYAFQDKYLLSATYRQEGSSRFGTNNKWGNFPAASLGWRISEETFIPDFTWLTDLMLRGSWGITGNNNIGNYTSFSSMAPSNYVLGGNYVTGQVLSSFGNPDLGWEQSNEVNFGMDLALFESKMTLTAEYYRKITTDMLLPVRIPVISGFQNTFSNIGEIENKGLEFNLGYRTSVNNFNIRTNFNIGFNRNKVLDIGGDNDEIRNGGLYGPNNVSVPGRPIGMLHGFKMLGIFNTQEEIDAAPTQSGAHPGVYIYEDTNGDGEISYDTEDMVEIGNPHPNFVWGFNLGGDFKKFDLSLMITGAQGYDLYRQIEKTSLNMDGVFNLAQVAENRWRSADNPGNGYIATSDGWQWQREANSRYVYDASHAWLKNLTLGYTFSGTNNIMNDIRLYASADNLLLITSYPGNNPEVNQLGGINPGVDDETYPVPRTLSLGAVINF
ncbi:MAG: TonB-dependent receptor [Balneolales bacterium]